MLQALAGSEPEATLALLLRLQRRKSVEDQRSAALALQAFASESVLKPLGRALAAEDESVVEAGLQSLVALAQRDGPQALVDLLEPVAELDPEGPLAQLRADALAVLESDG